MRIIQYRGKDGARRVGTVSNDGNVRTIRGATNTYELAMEAIRKRQSIEGVIEERISDEKDLIEKITSDKRIHIPFHHPDPYHQFITGTGLSHLGSAAARNSMHTKLSEDESSMTDSMKMFKWGLDGGKPETAEIGTQAEWFYKGNGDWVVDPEAQLSWPTYALDGGEEVEIAGIYVVDEKCSVWRVGYALANEYADHVMEKQNYLYLAHSKLRHCSYGPELLIGELPDDVTGKARLLRSDNVIWEEDWLSGNKNMSHSIENLEHHHFKYTEFRRPGDVHIHFFGAATGSFTKNIETKDGDIFEIESETFGSPLRNTLSKKETRDEKITVKTL
ncbi:MAG: FAH family protein [Burkholderiales bacterium]|nr:FAH family protein [Burkholderiales bacterium]OUT77591.1 MAG: FAH family protein [Betaproteobacteria bacterium TMED22]